MRFQTAPSWARPISEFLENGVLPMDETEARQIQRRASAYSIINNKLIKRSSTGVFHRCVEQDRGIDILLDIHQGKCGHHAASRSLVAKAFRHGFYWPTTLEDAKSLVLKAKDASASANAATSRRQHSAPYRSPGPSRSGDSTWWDPSKPPEAA